jgi:hypothetical protein
LHPDDVELAGNWVMQNGHVVADATEQRIKNLVEHCLIEIGRSDGGWSTLYRDPTADTLWELTYPRSEMHGGGPRLLRRINASDANHKYGLAR